MSKSDRAVKHVETDVLVVGGGGAALRAAIEAQKAGARVAVAVKGQLGVIGLRGGGATASGAGPDWRAFWPLHPEGGSLKSAYEEIIQLGLGMADPALARIVVEEAPASRRALWRLGIGDGTWRIVSPVPILTGIVRASTCALYERTMITRLLVDAGHCVGAMGLHEKTGEVIVIRAGAVILGTGGAAGLFKHNVHPSCVTGDGYAIGYMAGAELMNMEFMQIYLGTVYPTINNLSRWPWGQDVHFYNKDGEEFLQNYLPPGATVAEAMAQQARHTPFTTRDRLSRYLMVGMIKEVLAGRGTARGCIYMDMTSPKVRPPKERDLWMRYRGIEWDRERCEAIPYAMCSHGGLRINSDGETTVRGLYALGECASGPYGADRHGGNMMAASQVFGSRAGIHAARRACGTPHGNLPAAQVEAEKARIAGLASAKGSCTPNQAAAELRQMAWEKALALRTDKGLRTFLETVDQTVQERLPDLQVRSIEELVRALELENLVLVGEMLGRAALERTESRGGHYREDYPQRDDARWLKSIVIKRVDGKMELHPLVLDANWNDRPGDMGSESWSDGLRKEE